MRAMPKSKKENQFNDFEIGFPNNWNNNMNKSAIKLKTNS